MRKEVKRSLLLWPAMVCVAISGLTWFHSPESQTWNSIAGHAKFAWRALGGPKFIAPYLADACPTDRFLIESRPSVPSAPQVLHPIVPPPEFSVDLVERIDQGSPAMQLPERLAMVDAETEDSKRWFPATRETAMTLLESMRDLDVNIPSLAKEFFAGQGLADASTAGRVSDDEFTSTAMSDSPVIVLLETPAGNEITIDEIASLGESTDELLLNNAAADRLPSDAVTPSADPEPTLKDLLFAELGPSAIEQLQTDATAESKSIIPQSISNLGDLAARSEASTDELVPAVAKIETEHADQSRRQVPEMNPATWPLTSQLNEQLELLASLTIRMRPSSASNHLVSTSPSTQVAAQWAETVTDRLAQLRSLDRLGNPRAGSLLADLEQLALDGLSKAEQTVDRNGQIEWLRTAHAVKRRVAVWQGVFRIVSASDLTMAAVGERASIERALHELKSELPGTGDPDGWNRFLLLDEIASAAESGQIQQRSAVAKRFLARLKKDDLHPLHQQWLAGESIVQLSDSIRPWSSVAIDYAALLAKIERQESDTIDVAANEIAETTQSLRLAENPDAVGVADAINTHYRNANARISVSEAMMQRLLPKIEPKTMPVRTQIFSSRVNGVSRVETDLKVDLQPANDRWSLTLQTLGNIQTQSVGRKGTTSVSTSRNSRFLAATPIELSPRGVQIEDSTVDVTGATRLKGIRTDFDGWPLFGPLLRGVAESQFYQKSGTTNWIANRRIKSQLGTEIDQRLNEGVQRRSDQLQESVLGPLGSLRLDPKVVDLQTTEDRLIARYRLAGDWQLAAFTPRPRAPRTSLMSVQVHQSALNNTMEQLVPRDRSKSIDEMIVQGLSLFGVTNPQLPSDLPEGVQVQFAKTRPITVEIEDGIMWMTLRIVRLTRDRLKLSRFIVRAAYRPEIDGINAYLVRDGHLRISGPGMAMRQRLPIRAIFNKVLASSRKFPITVPGLTSRTNTDDLVVSQLELRDGWIAMAISERDAPRIALRVREE